MLGWFKNVWEGRHVIKVLTLASMKAEYSYTFFGFLWLLLKPAMMVLAIVATFYFRAGDIELATYALTVTYGVVIWNMMSGVITGMTNLVYTQTGAFRKTTLPREVISVIPAARVFVDLIFGLGFIIIAHLFLLQAPSLLGLGAFVLAAFLGVIIAYGMGLVSSILAVYFRDLRYLIQHFVHILFFITPIFLLEFPEGILTKTLYVNPFSLAIILGRFGEYSTHDMRYVLLSLVTWGVAFLWIGTFFYKKKIYDVVDIV